MTEPVDLTNLRSMTDGDAEMEQMLFEEFYSSCETLIDKLGQNIANNDNENWRKDAHAIKGIAYNLGAAHLGNLCKQAQDSPDMPGPEKQGLLQAIRIAYHETKRFLEKVHS